MKHKLNYMNYKEIMELNDKINELFENKLINDTLKYYYLLDFQSIEYISSNIENQDWTISVKTTPEKHPETNNYLNSRIILDLDSLTLDLETFLVEKYKIFLEFCNLDNKEYIYTISNEYIQNKIISKSNIRIISLLNCFNKYINL